MGQRLGTGWNLAPTRPLAALLLLSFPFLNQIFFFWGGVILILDACPETSRIPSELAFCIDFAHFSHLLVLSLLLTSGAPGLSCLHGPWGTLSALVSGILCSVPTITSRDHDSLTLLPPPGSRMLPRTCLIIWLAFGDWGP